MILKEKNNIIDIQKRQHFKNNEIFFECCSILDQSQFSNELTYFFFKRRNRFSFTTKFRNRCIYSGYQRSVSSYFKTSRHVFSNKILTNSMTGFYRAI